MSNILHQVKLQEYVPTKIENEIEVKLINIYWLFVQFNTKNNILIVLLFIISDISLLLPWVNQYKDIYSFFINDCDNKYSKEVCAPCKLIYRWGEWVLFSFSKTWSGLFTKVAVILVAFEEILVECIVSMLNVVFDCLNQWFWKQNQMQKMILIRIFWMDPLKYE